MHRRTRNFTLVELLTVIMIIVILTGFLIPAVTTVRTRAKEARAAVAIKSLQTAIKQYEATYGYLPVAPGGGDLTIASGAPYTTFVGILNGGNARAITFLEVASSGTFQDPWEHDYHVVIDADYGGSVTVGVDTINSSSAIWSYGKDGGNDSGDNDDIASWK